MVSFLYLCLLDPSINRGKAKLSSHSPQSHPAAVGATCNDRGFLGFITNALSVVRGFNWGLCPSTFLRSTLYIFDQGYFRLSWLGFWACCFVGRIVAFPNGFAWEGQVPICLGETTALKSGWIEVWGVLYV